MKPFFLLLLTSSLAVGFIEHEIPSALAKEEKSQGQNTEDILLAKIRSLISKHGNESQFRVTLTETIPERVRNATVMVYDVTSKRLILMRQETRLDRRKETRLLYLFLDVSTKDLNLPFSARSAGDVSLLSGKDSVWGAERLSFKNWPKELLDWPK